jgi:glycosyltransferase involved in cell wall biosynthesis
MKSIVVGWKVSTLNPNLASLRYRALLPMLALERYGIQRRIIRRPTRNCLAGLDALVIVKSFTPDDCRLAQDAANIGLPVIFDLCDNIFVEQYGDKTDTSPADIFLLIASVASGIVVTTEPLADVVREKLNRRVPVYIVPDGIETPDLLATAKEILRGPQLYELRGSGKWHVLNVVAAFRSSGVKALKRFIRGFCRKSFRLIKQFLNWRYWAKLLYRCFDRCRAEVRGLLRETQQERVSVDRSGQNEHTRADNPPQKRKKILWFGNHGGSHANFGMLDLLYIREALESLAAELPVELLVVSNNYDKYNKHIRPLAIPTRYLEWNADSMAQHFSDADVVVIPNSLDEFSFCKSSNRTVLALAHGVPVVATLTPSLDPLRKCILVDDFEEGLRRYLTDDALARRHVKQGKRLIERLYGQEAIGKLWSNVINEVLRARTAKPGAQAELVIALQLPQDIDLATPIVKEAVERGISVALWTSSSALSRWPQLARAILRMGVPWKVLPDHLIETNVFSEVTRGLLSITETNLNPHDFTHQLAKLANRIGLHTATMQHGYENVGLTYSDDVHDIRHVRFASQQIFIWGPMETLDPKIHPQTFRKCFPVGCPKPLYVPTVLLHDGYKPDRPLVGIFENLHWHRYLPEYQEFFLEGVKGLAQAFPNVDFLVKPHDAGMWLTSRYEGDRPQADNLIVIDPKESRWVGITAAQLFSHLTGVITTPSTVALDAARLAIPVAVVAHNMPLDNYEPLPFIRDQEGWGRLVSQMLASSERDHLQKKASEFVSRAILPGNAAGRIVEEMMSHKHGRYRHVA